MKHPSGWCISSSPVTRLVFLALSLIRGTTYLLEKYFIYCRLDVLYREKNLHWWHASVYKCKIKIVVTNAKVVPINCNPKSKITELSSINCIYYYVNKAISYNSINPVVSKWRLWIITLKSRQKSSRVRSGCKNQPENQRSYVLIHFNQRWTTSFLHNCSPAIKLSLWKHRESLSSDTKGSFFIWGKLLLW